MKEQSADKIIVISWSSFQQLKIPPEGSQPSRNLNSILICKSEADIKYIRYQHIIKTQSTKKSILDE